MERLSLLKTPSDSLALVEIPHHPFRPDTALTGRLVLALDDVQNPGNLGTIIRLADWFGITDIVCSEASADCFNPKVVGGVRNRSTWRWRRGSSAPNSGGRQARRARDRRKGAKNRRKEPQTDKGNSRHNADDGKNLKSTGGAADRQAAPLFTGYRPSAATPNRA